ncbi:MAG: PrsW family intramembrane metalloprotease [Anaerolineales bacterium]|nr:PrsW family intramembrane metalloprotease [Anaerolineales bacterium]
MKNNKDISIEGASAVAERSPVEQSPQSKGFNWLSAGQFAFSLSAVLFLFLISLISIITVLLGIPSSDLGFSDTQVVSSLLFAAGLGFAGILLIPSTIYSGRRLFGNRPPISAQWDKMAWLAYFFPIPILFGFLIQNGPAWGYILLPVIHVLANGASIFWVLNLGRRKFPARSAQRNWGAFGAGLTLTPAITFVIEIALLIMIGIFWLILIQTRPDLEQDILYLMNLVYESSPDSEVPARWIGEFVARPEVTGTIFFYFSLLIPLVEELLKPIAVYFLLGRKLQPWEGFMIGATAGAGYALFENLTIGAGADTWTFVMISRLGTAAIHILTTGLVGWGLASAWTEKKYFRLAGSFLAAVSLHGVWNGLNIFNALAEFPAYQDQISPFFVNFARYAPVGLILLAAGSIVGLVRANLLLRRAIIAQD